MKVLVNKSPYTGELFECNKAYASHLRKLRAERAAEAKAKRIKDNWNEWLATEKLKIIHPDQIVPWFLENFNDIVIAFNSGIRVPNMSGWMNDKARGNNVFTHLEFSNLKYSKTVSNTHNCPIGGEQNFFWSEDKPRGYPGWTGNVSGKVLADKQNKGSFPTTSLLNLVGINTGSGGGGLDSWGYQVYLYLADWPGMQHEVDMMEQDKIVSRLKGVRSI